MYISLSIPTLILLNVCLWVIFYAKLSALYFFMVGGQCRKNWVCYFLSFLLVHSLV